MRIGIGKAGMTAFIKGVGMLGYGHPKNIIKGQATPQYARAYIFEQNDVSLIWVCAEICFITDILKMEVLNRLNTLLPDYCKADNLMLTAQHTHSGAGGYQQHFFYNIPFDGLQPEVLDTYTNGIVEAILMAHQSLMEGFISYQKSRIADHEEVAFNRSLAPYNANTDTRKYRPDERHLALDREMKLLSFYDIKGNLRGSINWFGVHTTTLSNRNNLISYDNKGYAAEFLEKAKGGVHAFAQDAAGDISPNFIWNKQYKEYRGKYEKETESAEYNGDIQYRKAKEIIEMKATPFQTSRLDYVGGYTDWSKMETNTPEGLVFTGQSALGMSFLEGTTDGQGAPKAIGSLTRKMISVLNWYEKKVVFRRLDSTQKDRIHRDRLAQFPKSVVIEAQRKRLLLAPHVRKVILPKFSDASIRCLKELDVRGFTLQNWLPHIFQFQVFMLDKIVLIGMPCEVTTTAAKRLRETAIAALSNIRIEEVIISSYANGYAGYLTTPEEYELQYYEGGHTPFGKWTLPCCQAQIAFLCQELCRPKANRQLSTFQMLPTLLPNEAVWTRPYNSMDVSLDPDGRIPRP